MAGAIGDQIGVISLELQRPQGSCFLAEYSGKGCVQVQALGGLSAQVVESLVRDVGSVKIEDKGFNRFRSLFADQVSEARLRKGRMRGS